MTDLELLFLRTASAMWRVADEFPRCGSDWPATEAEMEAEILLIEFEKSGGYRHHPMSSEQQLAAEAHWAKMAEIENLQAKAREVEKPARESAEAVRQAATKSISVAKCEAARANPTYKVFIGRVRYLGGGYYGIKDGRREIVIPNSASSKGATVRLVLKNDFLNSWEIA